MKLIIVPIQFNSHKYSTTNDLSITVVYIFIKIQFKELSTKVDHYFFFFLRKDIFQNPPPSCRSQPMVSYRKLFKFLEQESILLNLHSSLMNFRLFPYTSNKRHTSQCQLCNDTILTVYLIKSRWLPQSLYLLFFLTPPSSTYRKRKIGHRMHTASAALGSISKQLEGVQPQNRCKSNSKRMKIVLASTLGEVVLARIL